MQLHLCCTGVFGDKFVENLSVIVRLAKDARLDRKLRFVMYAKAHYLCIAVRHPSPAILGQGDAHPVLSSQLTDSVHQNLLPKMRDASWVGGCVALDEHCMHSADVGLVCSGRCS